MIFSASIFGAEKPWRFRWWPYSRGKVTGLRIRPDGEIGCELIEVGPMVSAGVVFDSAPDDPTKWIVRSLGGWSAKRLRKAIAAGRTEIGPKRANLLDLTAYFLRKARRRIQEFWRQHR